MRSARARLVPRRAALLGRCALPRRARTRGQRGAAAVELALILPVVLSLMYGIITAGLSYTNALGLTNAVREGARFGATTDRSKVANFDVWANSVIQRVRDTQFDDPQQATGEPYATRVCVQLAQANGVGGTKASPLGSTKCAGNTSLTSMPDGYPPSTGSIADNTCVVLVWAAREFTIQVAFPVWTEWKRTMTKSSVVRYERAGSSGTC